MDELVDDRVCPQSLLLLAVIVVIDFGSRHVLRRLAILLLAKDFGVSVEVFELDALVLCQFTQVEVEFLFGLFHHLHVAIHFYVIYLFFLCRLVLL